MTVEENGAYAATPMEPEIDLKSLALTIAENLWLLLAGVLIAMLVAVVATSSLPSRFVSQATIDPTTRFPQATADSTAHLRANLARRLPLLLGSQEVLRDAIKAASIPAPVAMDAEVTVRAGRADGLITVNVSASSAIHAQALAQAVLDATYRASRPQGEEKARLETERKRLLAQAQDLGATAAKLNAALSSASHTAQIGTLASGQAQILNSMETLQELLDINQAQLNGLTPSAVVQAPTLPMQASGPNRFTWVAVAVLGTLIVLLIFILLRHAWHSPVKSPAQDARIRKLREKYGLGKMGR